MKEEELTDNAINLDEYKEITIRDTLSEEELEKIEEIIKWREDNQDYQNRKPKARISQNNIPIRYNNPISYNGYYPQHHERLQQPVVVQLVENRRRPEPEKPRLSVKSFSEVGRLTVSGNSKRYPKIDIKPIQGKRRRK